VGATDWRGLAIYLINQANRVGVANVVDDVDAVGAELRVVAHIEFPDDALG